MRSVFKFILLYDTLILCLSFFLRLLFITKIYISLLNISLKLKTIFSNLISVCGCVVDCGHQ